MDEVRNRLASLVRLRDEGLLSAEEFAVQRAAILARNATNPPTTTTMGTYTLLEEVGEGGMGRVFRGRHRVEAIALRQGGDVAVKVLHAHLSRDARQVERFVQEAEALGRLDHPNIVKVFDVVQSHDEVAIVMEWIPGRTLREMLAAETGPIPWERARAIVEPLLDALSHAHARGVVHRDIKPDNIQITTTGAVKLLDFGIARLGDVRSRTRTGTGMGTIDYMAPEQYADAKSVDHRADVYAIGMTLYEMLAGRLPWDPNTATEFETMQVKHRGSLPPPTAFYPDIPPWVVDAVVAAIAPSLTDRLPSMDALRAALRLGETGERGPDTDEVVLYEEPAPRPVTPAITAPEIRPLSTSTTTAPQAPPRKHTMVLLAVTGVVCALLAVLLGALALRAPNTPPDPPGGPPADLLAMVAFDMVSPAQGAPSVDARRARYKEACAKGEQAACALSTTARLPVASWKGFDVEALDRACTKGQQLSCLMVVRLLGTRGPASLPGDDSPDAARAARVGAKACDAGSTLACSELGRLYSKGGSAADEAKAVTTMQQACDKGELRACANLGVQYERGEGVPADRATALRLFSKACDGGALRGCTYLGSAFTRSGHRDEPRAHALFMAACSAGEVLGCLRLGSLLEASKAYGEDHAQAAVYYKRACDGGEGWGCSALGKLSEDGIGVARDLAAAREYDTLACDDAVGPACLNLANLLMSGAGGPVDAAGATQRFQRACELGEREACGKGAR